jgi:hypothetical protein
MLDSGAVSGLPAIRPEQSESALPARNADLTSNQSV